MKTNHYGITVNSETPVTGVINSNNVLWEFIDDEICMTCNEIISDIESDESLSDDERQDELDCIECTSDHERLIGDWIMGTDGLYHPDMVNGEFAGIERESTVQIVWSKFTARGALCSPCYPGQVDLDSEGPYLGFTMPAELIYSD